MHRSYAVPALALLLTAFLSAQQRTASQEKAIAERTIDPTWLYRNSNALPEKPSDIRLTPAELNDIASYLIVTGKAAPASPPTRGRRGGGE